MDHVTYVNGSGSHGADDGIQIDSSKASKWVYPKNVPTRQYQLEIAKTALFNNTLVCLPTGLGKTLIAAVVMYNYYNWFPQGKVVFLAPTKPLVDQQREACLYQVSIPQFETAEMTGKQKPELRKALWKKKRVFFCTPQIFEKDLLKMEIPRKEFVCVIVDECHRSTGNYATVRAIHQLRTSGVKFRTVGLSATPGRTHKSIQEVINNLMITRVEFRDESDPEIQQHTHEKAVEAITVHSQPELTSCYKMLYSVMNQVTHPLIEAKVFFVKDAEKITRYGLISAHQEFKQFKRSRFRNANELTTAFNQAIFLASLSENLDCGIRVAHEFIQGSLKDRPWLRVLPAKYPTFKQLSGALENLISLNWEHPKMRKLMEILDKHFKAAPKSRVIIFTSLRETVADIVTSLDQQEASNVIAKIFIGQGSGSGRAKMTQAGQKKVLQDFREGKFNTLVATCIAEEGLDIPEVQLIICFDGAASPLRDTQRKGRTGRHGTGKVIYLLSEGKERRKFDRNQNESSYIKQMLSRGTRNFEMYDQGPRMVPRMYNPEMLLAHMETSQTQQKGGKKRKASSSDKDRSQKKLDSFLVAEEVEEEMMESCADIIYKEDAKEEHLDEMEEVHEDSMADRIKQETNNLAGCSSKNEMKDPLDPGRLRISKITARVFLRGGLLRKLRIPEDQNPEQEVFQGISAVSKNCKVLMSDSSQSKGCGDSSTFQHTPSLKKNPRGFLDLSASVSGTDQAEEDEISDEIEDLEDFIDDSIPSKDSENMMAIYRTALNGLKTPSTAQKSKETYPLTPGVTPYSQQTSYDSSFVTESHSSESLS